MTQEFSNEEKAMLNDIQSKLKQFEKERKNLIPILQTIQDHHSYLSVKALEVVAKYLDIPTSEVYGVATFYNQFKFNPPGRNPIKVCLGTACHVKAADIILENFERKLEISEGETTPDREFSLEKVACVGCCALAPVAVIDETVHGNMAPSKVEGLIFRIRMEKEFKEKKIQNESS